MNKVHPRSLAESYGLHVNDIICKPGWNGTDLMDIKGFLRRVKNGDRPLLVEVLRDMPQPVAGDKGGEERTLQNDRLTTAVANDAVKAAGQASLDSLLSNKNNARAGEKGGEVIDDSWVRKTLSNLCKEDDP